jgi:hypothetical protein
VGLYWLIYINAKISVILVNGLMWQPISSAPFDRDLELAVLEAGGEHALVFPCRRVANGWINATNGRSIEVRPTHWREWKGRPL